MEKVSKGYKRALNKLREPGARLVLTFSSDRTSGRAYYIQPNGAYVADVTATAILKRPDVYPCDPGLFLGHSQSWHLVA
jgi:hypothetical protein